MPLAPGLLAGAEALAMAQQHLLYAMARAHQVAAHVGSVSRRSVLTRSCAALGILPGAATTHSTPAAVNLRARPKPVGPAS